MEATYAPARASLLDPMRAWRGEIRERLPESALRQVSRAVTRHPLYECKAAGIEVWFSQTPMRLINWELPLILRFRLGPVIRAVSAFAWPHFGAVPRFSSRFLRSVNRSVSCNAP